jgi:predicted nucleic acid-binding protein
MTIAVDANVFIYVLEQNQSFWQDALDMLKAIESGEVAGIASELTYLEVLSDRKLTDKKAALTEQFLRDTGVSFGSVTLTVLQEAARLRRTTPGLKTPDAIHLATALQAGATHFVTNDRALLKRQIPGIQLLDLASTEATLFPRDINRLAP